MFLELLLVHSMLYYYCPYLALCSILYRFQHSGFEQTTTKYYQVIRIS